MTEPKKPRTLFFDIEAGGLSGHHSPILSISHGFHGEKVQSVYAAPAYGARVYSWSHKNVWEPIQSRLRAQGRRPVTERTALESFLGVLESEPAGGTLAGWNIGYQRIGQDIGESKTRGFDIPMLLTRARAYGLDERYQAALGKFQIRDVGQEYAWKLANEALQFPEHIEKDLFDQIQGYVKAGKGYQAQTGAGDIRTARWLATQGYKVSGWKQELLHGTVFPNIPLQAHISEEDVLAGQRLLDEIHNPIFGGDINKVKAWQEKALRNKYLTGLRYSNSPEKAADILGRASKPISASGAPLPSVEEGLRADIKGMAASYGMQAEEILRGEPIEESYEKFFSSSPTRAFSRSKFVSDVFQFSAQHKVGIGMGIAAGILWAAKPLSWFSNTESQYDVSKEIKSFSGKQTAQERFNIFRKALNVYGEEVGTGHKRILIPKSVLSEKELENQLGFIPVKIAVPEAGQDTNISWRSTKNNYHIHSHGEEWTMHEDKHAASTMLFKKWQEENKKKDSSIFSPIGEFFKGIPHIITEGIPGIFYFAKGKISGGDDMTERIHQEGSDEYLKLEQQLAKSGKSKDLRRLQRLVESRLSGKDDRHNTIQGLRHGGMAQQKRRELTDFGSGYQGDKKQERENSLLLPLGLAGAGSAAGGFGVRHLFDYGWGGSGDHLAFDPNKYPRLQRLRSIGSKHGYSVLREFEKGDFLTNLTQGDHIWDPREAENFQGILYNKTFMSEWKSMQIDPPKMKDNVINWKHDLMGADKWKTYKYFQRQGFKSEQPETITFSSLFYKKPMKEILAGFSEEQEREFFANRKKDSMVDFYERLDKARDKILTDQGVNREEFLKFFEDKRVASRLNRKGIDIQTAVFKDKTAANFKGVWFGISNLPDEIIEDMVLHPRQYLLQKFHPLTDEFRVVTVGGKSIFSAHRFGSSKAKKLLTSLEDYAPSLYQFIKDKQMIENTIPIKDQALKARLEAFTENFAQKMPKGVEISAFDVGLTETGEFKMIEAQKSFGTFRNSVLNRRIEETITGRRSRLYKGSIGAVATAGAAIALLAYSAFSGKDDAHNTIEGLRHGGMAEKKRRELTDFGSGMIATVFGGISGFLSTPKKKVMPAVMKYARQRFGITKFSEGMLFAPGPHSWLTARGADFGYELAANKPLMRNALRTLYGEVSDSEMAKLFPTVLGHEISEIHYLDRLVQMTKGMPFYDRATAMGKIIPEKKIGSHLSMGVVADELLLSAKLGPEHYKAMKRFRKADLDQAKEVIDAYDNYLNRDNPNAGFRRLVRLLEKKHKLDRRSAVHQTGELKKQLKDGTLIDSFRRYVSKTEKLISTFEQKMLPRFSTADNTWNATSKRENKNLLVLTEGQLNSPHRMDSSKLPKADEAYGEFTAMLHTSRLTASTRKKYGFRSKWIRQALKRGISKEKIGTAVVWQTAGTITSETVQEILQNKNNINSLLERVRKETGLTVGGEYWRLGRVFKSGGIGVNQMVYGPQGKVGLMKRLKSEHRDLDLMVKENKATMNNPHLNKLAFEGGDTKAQSFLYSYGTKISEIMKEQGFSTVMEYEAHMQRLARKAYGDIVPEVYASGPGVMIQEFAGKQEGITAKALFVGKERFQQIIRTARGDIPAHLDPKIDQPLRHGARIQIGDWGLSVTGFEKLENGRETMEKVIERAFSSNRIENAIKQTKVINQVNLQRQASKSLSLNASRSGSRHRQKSGSLVSSPPSTIVDEISTKS